MKIIKALLFVLLTASTGYAQDYHIFRRNGNEGLTDNNGTEIIAPIYDKHNWLDKKNLVVMQPYTDYSTDKKPVLLFNCNTQEKTYYKSFNTDAVHIGTDTFSVVIDKNKKTFLWSELGDKKIQLPGGDYFFKSIGSRYVVADYFPDHESEPVETVKAKPVTTKKIAVANKKVVFKVPAIVKYKLDTYYSYQQDYAVFENTGDFKQIMKGKYTSYKPLYAVTDDGDPVLNYEEEASGILFSDGDMHTLYDSVMKKVTVFKMVVPKDFKDGNFLPDNEKAVALLKKCSTLLNTKVDFQFVGRVMMVSDRVRLQPKPKPVLITTDTTDGTIVSIRDVTGIATQILFTKHKIEVDENNNEISITIPGEKNTTDIYVDMDKKKIWLPMKYNKPLGLTVY